MQIEELRIEEAAAPGSMNKLPLRDDSKALGMASRSFPATTHFRTDSTSSKADKLST
jgi:hypothetical protein